MIISIDYGTRRTGFALSDEGESIALAYPACLYTKNEELIDYISKLITKYEPRVIILGLPLGLEEKPTQISIKIEKFGELLKEKFNIDVVYWNETMTSVQASRFVKKDKKGSLDSESARILLQEYLDFKKGK